MDKERVIICIDCKRELLATTENFTELKKGKYGLNNACKESRKLCGIDSGTSKAVNAFDKSDCLPGYL